MSLRSHVCLIVRFYVGVFSAQLDLLSALTVQVQCRWQGGVGTRDPAHPSGVCSVML